MKVGDALASGEPLTIAGFGTFAICDRPPRQGRNPRTGAPIATAASRTPMSGQAGACERPSMRYGSDEAPAAATVLVRAAFRAFCRHSRNDTPLAAPSPAGHAAPMRSLCLVLLLVCSPAVAQQFVFDSYDHVRRNVFWQEVCPRGGATLYCGLPFAAGQRAVDGRRITIEHAYPADWIASHHRCENRNSCEVDAYGRAAADWG